MDADSQPGGGPIPHPLPRRRPGRAAAHGEAAGGAVHGIPSVLLPGRRSGSGAPEPALGRDDRAGLARGEVAAFSPRPARAGPANSSRQIRGRRRTRRSPRSAAVFRSPVALPCLELLEKRRRPLALALRGGVGLTQVDRLLRLTSHASNHAPQFADRDNRCDERTSGYTWNFASFGKLKRARLRWSTPSPFPARFPCHAARSEPRIALLRCIFHARDALEPLLDASRLPLALLEALLGIREVRSHRLEGRPEPLELRAQPRASRSASAPVAPSSRWHASRGNFASTGTKRSPTLRAASTRSPDRNTCCIW